MPSRVVTTLVSLALTLAAPAHAIQQQVTRPELCAIAERVAVVEIVSIDAARNGKDQIDRVVTARVDQDVKNTRGSELLFTLLGGKLDDGDWYWVSDQPNLLVGATYLVFLTGPDAYANILGGDQGAIRLTDGKTKRGAEDRDAALASLGGCDAN